MLVPTLGLAAALAFDAPPVAAAGTALNRAPVGIQPPPPVLPPAREDPGATPSPPAPTPEEPGPPAPAPSPNPTPRPAPTGPAPVPTPPASTGDDAGRTPAPSTDADSADASPFSRPPPPGEPPQPAGIGVPAPPESAPNDQTAGDPAAPATSGGTAAPSMVDNPRLDLDGAADPGAPLATADPLPPPPRPRFGGVGLMSAAGVTFAAAIGQHVGSYIILRRRCIDPIGKAGGIDEVDNATANACYQGGVPGLALHVLGDLSLASTISLTAAGAGTRARRDAYDDRFADRPAKSTLPLEIAGASLLGAGALLFISSAAGTWGGITACEDATCVRRLRLTNVALREVAGAMGGAGAGMLTYGLLYRRRYFEYGAIYRRRPAGAGAPAPELTVAPMWGAHPDRFELGLSFTGRF